MGEASGSIGVEMLSIFQRRTAIGAIALCAIAAIPALAFNPGAKKSSVAEADIGKLKPGEYIWSPELAPRGPMTVVVSLPAQRAYVYRNGVRIGATTVSSGKPGHSTPTGVFTILQKDKNHHSNKYSNAPMPYMQRLTWDGIALHAGGLPGYPASHGCVRLPLAFSEALFKETSMGMTVVITNEQPATQNIIDPHTLTGLMPASAAAAAENHFAKEEDYNWQPQLSPGGPLTILASTADQRALVLRNGVVIGAARVKIPPGEIVGTRAVTFTGFDEQGRGKWFYIGLAGHEGENGERLIIAEHRNIIIPPKFYREVRDILVPGTTMVLVEGSIAGGGAGEKLTVLASE
ncbi:MAG TPA: L,D-transpeptidase [Rhizomicrobium sp.]|nr:L,D-transpeptidase [Rhizomicrobium sp.]